MGTSVTTKNMDTASNDEQFWPLNDAAGGPPLVYVVDDHVAVAGLVSLYLARNGFRTQVFHSSATALAAFVSAVTKPGLLIADFSMPDSARVDRANREICGLANKFLVRVRQESLQNMASFCQKRVGGLGRDT